MNRDGRSLNDRAYAAIRTRADRVRPGNVVGSFASNISLASRLVLVVLVVTIASLVVVSTVSLIHGADLADRLLQGQMQSLASLKAKEVDRAITGASSQVSALARSQMIAEAAQRFTDAYAAIETGDNPMPAGAAEELARYYQETFGPALEEATGTNISRRQLMPDGNAAIYLQHSYIATNPAGSGAPRSIDDAGDGSAWSSVHRELHPRILEIADQLGLEDVYIIEPVFATAVYTTEKAPDFATSLDRGPYSSSSLATLVRSVRDDPEAGTVLADLAPYPPALGAPVGFIASPIVVDGRLVGVLAVRMPVDRINAIMTSGGDWEDEGLGVTGEAYLVGADGRMRSVSRPFLEDPDGYFDAVAEAGSINEQDLDAVHALGTTILFQRAADRDRLEAAEAGERGVIESTSYTGLPVFTSFEPLGLEQLNWYVAVEIGQDEVNEPLTLFRRAILIAASVFVLAITFLTVAWARRALNPIRVISRRLRRAAAGEVEQQPGTTGAGPFELGELNADIDSIMELMRQYRARLDAASAERLDTLRGLLPPEIVERIHAGDHLVVEQVRQASMVVVVLEGMGELIQSGDVVTSRSSLNEVVNLLDELVARYGLERVKIVGDLYYAGCGLSHVYLDHAPRAVDFAQAARLGLGDLSEELAHPLRPAIGVDSGPVSVGLGGSSRLVYDVWGDTLSTAYLFAHRAEAGEILISERTKAMLPPEVEVEECEGADPTRWRVLRSAITEGVDR